LRLSAFSILRAEPPDFRVPFGVQRVLRHAPIEVRRAVVPADRTALAERSFYVVDRLVRGDLSLQVVGQLRVADRATGRPQPSNQIGSLRPIESRIRHAPESRTTK
jgi:hypothetical protein